MKQILPTMVSESATELIPLLEVYQFLRAGFTTEEVNADAQKPIIEMLLTAAISGTESFLNYDLRERSWLFVLDKFPARVMLPKYPFKSLTTLGYYDIDDVLQTLPTTAYKVYNHTKKRAWIEFDLSLVPDLYDRLDAIQITFKSGLDKIVGNDRLATLLAVSKFYDDRSDNGRKYPPESERLLRGHRMGNF
jgi:uncharacterized phiE125 gp8 family phage protein